MKNYLLVTLLASFIGLATVTNAESETNFVENAKTIVATNLNMVLIEILSGTKDAGKEIYGASKMALSKSVDFVTKEAPEVVKQFLMWKTWSSVVWVVGWVGLAAVFLWVSMWLRRKVLPACRNDSDSEALSWIGIAMCRIIACLFLFFGVGTNVLEIVKINVAPKVYIIEYVIDTVKAPNRR